MRYFRHGTFGDLFEPSLDDIISSSLQESGAKSIFIIGAKVTAHNAPVAGARLM